MTRPGPALVLATALVAACTAPGGSSSRPPSEPTTPPATAIPTATPSGPAAASPSPTRSPSPAPTVGRPDADRALRLATLLAEDVGPRPAGGPGDGVARLMVASWLRDAGWDVEEQPVPLPQGGTTANLVATVDGRGTSGPHVVIGAHLDTVAGSPGGNDNASGIGTLVVLAQELADEVPALPVPVVLVAFGAEEYQPSTPRVHHLGSEVYVDGRGDAVVAMLSLDMLGHGATTCICWFDAGPGTLADRLETLAGDGYVVERRGDISDHGPFARRGIPAAFLWTFFEPRLHSPADTAAHLQAAALRRATDLSVAFVRDLGPGDRDGLDPPG